MTYDEDKDRYTLSTGRSFFANHGILGLGPDLRLRGGYDETLEYQDRIVYLNASAPDARLTPEERQEIATLMITRWTEWAERA
jgi:hypothetical protein